MKYVRVPRELHTSDVLAEEACFSPGRYVRFVPPRNTGASHYVPLDKLAVVRDEPVKVQKGEAYRYAEIGDINVANGGVSFREMKGYRLPTERPARAENGDVLISTVRTYRKGIGLVTDGGSNLVTTNAMLNLCAVTDFALGATLPYIFAFLRSDFFVEQVWSLLNRGVYPRMDTGALGKIVLPVSNDRNVCDYVSALALSIADKERCIRSRNDQIHAQIEAELALNQTGKAFQYAHPTLDELRSTLRLDTGLYCRGFRAFQHRVNNYRHGATTLSAMGVRSKRGPNLAVSVIGKSLYSEAPKAGWYELIRPVNISSYGTLIGREWFGNRTRLSLVNRGEIVFGCEATWRSVVLLDEMERCTTNFHGTVMYWPGAAIPDVIWLHTMLGFLREAGVLKHIAVGGQGGHLSPDYFDYIPLPKFPDSVRKCIAGLYHNPGTPPARKATLANFVTWHREWNEGLGIWELDRELKALQRTLADVQEQIIEGRTVTVPFECRPHRA
ncbi:MAG: hypothetical protein ABMA26_04470 [Limisphaerales bacterium]